MNEQTLTHLVDLAAERLGGSVLHATDDFFASKDNLLKPQEAMFIEGKYTDRGKWMDGWESRRRRDYAYTAPGPHPDFDSAIIRLGLPGIVRAFVVDTAFFTGNYPSACAIEGASIQGHPSLTTLLSSDIRWTPILPRTDLQGGSKNYFPVASQQRFTHLRFHIYPDGGVARLRVHGDVMPDARWMGGHARPQLVDLAAAEHGALVVACNDMFFGSRHNLIMPGRGLNMGDGWETKRSRRAGACAGILRELVFEGVLRVRLQARLGEERHPAVVLRAVGIGRAVRHGGHIERGKIGRIALEMQGIDDGALDGAFGGEAEDHPVGSGATRALRLPAVTHVHAAAGHDEVVARAEEHVVA